MSPEMYLNLDKSLRKQNTTRHKHNTSKYGGVVDVSDVDGEGSVADGVETPTCSIDGKLGFEDDGQTFPVTFCTNKNDTPTDSLP